MQRIHASFQVLRSLTFKRVVNAIKVFTGFYISRITGNAVHPAMPISIAIEPTTSCNLRCPECPSGLRSFSRPTGMIDQNFFKKVIDDVQSHVSYLTFYFQGEPFLHPGFLEMVSYANSKKIYTATSTNAHYLNEKNAEATVRSGLKRLIISIDGSSQDTYEQYRIGGSLDKVLEGAANVVKWKKKLNSSTPHIIFQCLVVKHNENQTEEIKKIAYQTGANEVRFKTAQVYDFKNGNDLIPEKEKYSRYKKNSDGTYSIKNNLDDHCWKMWQSCVVTWNGNVVPCCFDKDAKYVMGNLKEKSFREIWNSESYLAFRKSLFNHRNEIDICKNCTEGTKVFAG